MGLYKSKSTFLFYHLPSPNVFNISRGLNKKKMRPMAANQLDRKKEKEQVYAKLHTGASHKINTHYKSTITFMSTSSASNWFCPIDHSFRVV